MLTTKALDGDKNWFIRSLPNRSFELHNEKNVNVLVTRFPVLPDGVNLAVLFAKDWYAQHNQTVYNAIE